jgi:hypothetical protein
MIVFNLVCNNKHRFEGWFASAEDFEQQEKTDKLSCPTCGERQVSKALHAPYINTTGFARSETENPALTQLGASPSAGQYSTTGTDLSRLVDYLVTQTEDVGDDFAEEARKIHYQETPERKIRGQASAEEVQELREEGVDVIALPVPAYRLRKAH